MLPNSESFQKLPDIVKEALIQEQPHTRFLQAPSGLKFLLGGIIDIGFENHGLSKEELNIIHHGFDTTGVRIPGTPYKMRADGAFVAVIEKAGNEELPILPEDWAEGAYVLDPKTNKLLFRGSKVRPDQV